MIRFVAGRLASALLVLALITVAIYAIFFVFPANPAQLACGRPCTPDRLALVENFMGLDQPWYKQMFDYAAGILQGRTFGSGPGAIQCSAPCFGYSFQLRESVTDLIASRFPVTASLAIGAALLAVLIGVATGVFAALRRGTFWDAAMMTVTVAGVSAPVYLVALLAIFFFGFTLNVLPISGYTPLTQDPGGWLFRMILPWAVLAGLMAASYTRLTRNQLIDVLGENYIRTARATGISEARVVGRHGLRNVLIPVVTIFGLDLGGLLGGAVLTEKTFSMQGLGALLLDAVATLDVHVLVGVTLFSAFLIVAANLVVDIAYGLLDPRARTAPR